MIPQFPNFKKLELTDRAEFEEKTRNYRPYSDFNFVSLWNYNSYDLVEVSFLYDNIVIIIPDYITTKPFLSFLGNNQAIDTIHTLLNFSKEMGFSKELKLIPDINISSQIAMSDHFLFLEDRDNFDYILSVKELSELKGGKYTRKRNLVKKFKTNYPDYDIQFLDLRKLQHQLEIKELFYLWEKQKNISRDESKVELMAIEKLLVSANNFDLTTIGVYVDSSLVGFCIFEFLHNSFAMIHFQKANVKYAGIFQYLMNKIAISLEKSKYLYINYEQDLGIEGLRVAKESYRPLYYLKKYIIKER